MLLLSLGSSHHRSGKWTAPRATVKDGNVQVSERLTQLAEFRSFPCTVVYTSKRHHRWQQDIDDICGNSRTYPWSEHLQKWLWRDGNDYNFQKDMLSAEFCGHIHEVAISVVPKVSMTSVALQWTPPKVILSKWAVKIDHEDFGCLFKQSYSRWDNTLGLAANGLMVCWRSNK